MLDGLVDSLTEYKDYLDDTNNLIHSIIEKLKDLPSLLGGHLK